LTVRWTKPYIVLLADADLDGEVWSQPVGTRILLIEPFFNLEESGVGLGEGHAPFGRMVRNETVQVEYLVRFIGGGCGGEHGFRRVKEGGIIIECGYEAAKEKKEVCEVIPEYDVVKPINAEPGLSGLGEKGRDHKTTFGIMM
jgi:hypothetical protein